MTAADDILIQADGLSRYFGERCALEDASLRLRRGEVLGFLGPNGAGKSTTMRILSGVLAPSSGSVSIAGFNLLEQPLAARARLGFLPEQPPLYLDATVNEYLHHCARLHRVRRADAAEAVTSAKARCGLREVGTRLIGNLSKGYQQRVGIAQAIVHSPAVVILDEPTVGLDPIQIREIRALIRDLRSDHGILLSTHILPEVQATCDRVILINKGRIVMDSPLDQLSSLHNRWQIALKRPPQAPALIGRCGVESIQVIDIGHWLLSGSSIDSESLARLAVESDWGLTELSAQGRSLEEVFVQLTASDDGPRRAE
jgi:ABC-2 type transport system ATP-binding protein